jgi:hypothetical protein
MDVAPFFEVPSDDPRTTTSFSNMLSQGSWNFRSTIRRISSATISSKVPSWTPSIPEHVHLRRFPTDTRRMAHTTATLGPRRYDHLQVRVSIFVRLPSNIPGSATRRHSESTKDRSLSNASSTIRPSTYVQHTSKFFTPCRWSPPTSATSRTGRTTYWDGSTSRWSSYPSWYPSWSYARCRWRSHRHTAPLSTSVQWTSFMAVSGCCGLLKLLTFEGVDNVWISGQLALGQPQNLLYVLVAWNSSSRAAVFGLVLWQMIKTNNTEKVGDSHFHGLGSHSHSTSSFRHTKEETHLKTSDKSITAVSSTNSVQSTASETQEDICWPEHLKDP